jgi:hypothetical protein
MLIDFKKEGEIFKMELREGKYNPETSSNTEVDYAAEKEERDLRVYNDYLSSSAFTALCE